MDAHDIELGPALQAVYGRTPEGLQMQQLAGDASTRTYYRLRAPGHAPASLILMHLPPDPLASDEVAGGRPSELPFLAVQRALHARGLPVPHVHAHDVPRRVVLLEDLGDETFFDAQAGCDEAQRAALYGDAVDLLSELHARCAPPGTGLMYERRFDRDLLRWELDHFRQWGVEALRGPLSPADRSALDAHFDGVVERILTHPVGLVHRDYQSRNLMRRPDGSLVIIDFQDALLGPRSYDLVALLCDSYVELSLSQQQTMVARYAARAGIDEGALQLEFWQVALQRKLKDAGRFVFIDQVRGNPSFLASFPRSLRYAGRALSQLGQLHPGLSGSLQELVPGFPEDVVVPTPRTGCRATTA